MQFLRYLAVAVTIFAIAPQFAAAQESKKKTSSAEQAVVLKNATIHSMSGKDSFVGSILVVDGKIKSIGKSVDAPKKAKVVDLKGYHAVPGLIESRGKLWLTPAAVRESNTKAALSVVDAIDPWLEDWRELASQGITSVYVQPASTATLGGYGSVLRVGPHGSVDAIVMKKAAAVQASVGLTGRSSKDRFAQVAVLEKLFASAKTELDKAKKAEEAEAKDSKSKKGDKKKPEAKKDSDKKDEKKDSDEKEESDKDADKKEAKDKQDADEKEDKEEDKKDDDKKTDAKDDKKSKSKYKPTTDTSKIALMRVLKKEIPLNLEIHHSDVLRGVLKIAKKYKIRLVLDGLSNIDSCCEELAEAGYPAVVGPLFELGTPPTYRANADFSWLAKGTKEAPLWSLSGFSNSARSSRLLRMQASYAVQHGVSHGDALAAITSNAARMLGVADHVGTLEAGKQADIAIFAGDPLDPSTQVRMVMSHGRIIFEQEAKAQPMVASSDSESVELPAVLPNHYAIKTTRLLKGGKFTEGTLVIKDGKVVAASKKAKTGDAQVFDLKDAVVTSGLVAASSTLGQASAIVDSTESDASHLRAVDAVDPSAKKAKEILAGGFIHVGISPGTTITSAGVIGHLRLGASDYVANPAIASQFNLTNSARNISRFPSSLNGQLTMLGDVLDGKPAPSSVYVTAAIGRSINKAKIANIDSLRSGKTKAIISADSKLELRSAILLAKKNKLSAVIRSKGQVGDLAEKLAAEKLGLLIPAVNGTEYDSYLEHFIVASNAGCKIAFEGDSPEAIRLTAALLVAAGLDEQAALNGLTSQGGELVGMEKTSLTRGAPADFIVWSDSPLNLSAKPINVVVEGQVISTK